MTKIVGGLQSSCLGTEFEGYLLGFRGNAQQLAGFDLADEGGFVFYPTFLCLLYLVLGLLEVSVNFVETLAELLDFLVLLGLDLVDRDVLPAVEAAQLYRNAFDFILLLVELPLEGLQASLQ